MKVVNNTCFSVVAFGWHQQKGYADDVTIPAGEIAEVNGPYVGEMGGGSCYISLGGEVICQEKPDDEHGYQIDTDFPIIIQSGDLGITIRHHLDQPEEQVVRWRIANGKGTTSALKSGGWLVSARHGSYDDDHNLTESGLAQMRQLATAIKGAINGHELKVSLFCSTAPRAQQGIPVFAEVLGIPEGCISSHEFLWEDDYHSGDSEKAKGLVDEHLQDGSLIIFLSHLDMAPAIAYRAITKLGLDCHSEGLGYGQGMMITSEGLRVLP